MTTYGLVASGGGYRSFYTAGVLVWLKQNDIPLCHITSTSSGNNIALDYLLWDWEEEELPPVLTKTLRLNISDISEVFKNFAGLRPALIPTGSYLFEINKASTRRSLLLDDARRRRFLAEHLSTIQWDILTTNLTRRRSELFRINEVLAELSDTSIDKFLDIFIAGITTIPYFKAVKLGDDYYLEGGYVDNTPLRTLFENPEVEEILVIDFTNYDFHLALTNNYRSTMLTYALNTINMNLLVSDIQWCLPNMSILAQARFINQLIRSQKKKSIKVGDKSYYYKPLHVLTPANLESMTISLKEMRAQKEYFNLGKQEAESLFKNMVD